VENNAIVVKPSQVMVDQLGFDSYDDIVRNGYAQGFRGSKKIVVKFNYIIVTDGISRAMIGDINNVEDFESFSSSGRKVSRVNITFSNQREFDFNEIENIKWSSLNVRYIRI